jgi:hypothetical protein
MARPSVDPAHDALHAIERGAVQGLLEVGRVESSGVKVAARRRNYPLRTRLVNFEDVDLEPRAGDQKLSRDATSGA